MPCHLPHSTLSHQSHLSLIFSILPLHNVFPQLPILFLALSHPTLILTHFINTPPHLIRLLPLAIHFILPVFHICCYQLFPIELGNSVGEVVTLIIDMGYLAAYLGGINVYIIIKHIN